MVSDWGQPDKTKRRQVMISPYRATVLNFGFCFGFSCDIDSYVASTDEGQNSRAINKKKIVGPGRIQTPAGKR